jgi:hypothetical protein
MAWSPDGSLVYVDDRTAGDLPTAFLRAVSVATGEISTLAARDSIVRGRQTLFPVPYLADLSKLAFVEVGSGAGLRLMRSARAELRDMNGNVAAAIELPGRADDQLLLSPFWHGARADGRGVVFTILHSQSRIRTRRVDSGEMQEFVIDSAIAPLSLDWFRNVAPLALDPSGNVVGLIPADSGADAELRADGIVLIVVIGPDGRRLHAIKPPSGAEQIGLDGIAGNWISFRKKDATDPDAHAVWATNLRTGATRRISEHAYGLLHGPPVSGAPPSMKLESYAPTVTGPDGARLSEQRDAFYLVEPRGDSADLQRIEPEGAARTIRSLPKITVPSLRTGDGKAFRDCELNIYSTSGPMEDGSTSICFPDERITTVAVSGESVAWTERRATADSTAVWFAVGNSLPPSLLGTVGDVYPDLALATDGRRLAISNDDAILIYDLRQPAAPPRSLSMKPASGCYALRWVGPEGITALCSAPVLVAGPPRPDIYFRSVDGVGPPEAITRGENDRAADPTASQIRSALYSYMLSADSQTIVYPMRIRIGSTLWTAEFPR